jgi:molybdopterin synthase sulfur carrier subunit
MRQRTERRMAAVHFTSWLRELVPDGPLQAAGGTVGDALGAIFLDRPQVRTYLVDDQGRLRKHVCVFADGARLPHDGALRQAIRPDSKLYVMQALSGG